MDINCEPLKWQDAPKRTDWGHGMRVASIALDKDHTLDLYAEAEALHLVPEALMKLVRTIREDFT